MALNATSKLSKCLKIQARSVSWDTNPSGVIFSDRDIASATGGKLIRRGKRGAIVTDTRRLRRGDWFLALRGSNFDGRDFIQEACDKGCAGVILETQEYLPSTTSSSGEECGLVTVEGAGDGLRSLHALAKNVRKRYKGSVIGITGSCGKTTTRSMIGQLIQHLLPENAIVHETQGNRNNLVGLPQTLLTLNPNASYCILELGMSTPGEIYALQSICQPNIRLVTNVGLAHLEGVGSIKEVAKEKGQLIQHGNVGDICILNGDDAYVSRMRPVDSVECLRFGWAKDSDVRILDAVPSGSNRMSTDISLQIPDITRGNNSKVIINANVSAIGSQKIAANLAAAIATILALGIECDLGRLAEGIEQLEFHAMGRSQVLDIVHGDMKLIVIDDTYNSNPTSAYSALEMLQECGSESSGKHVVLGDMLELGENSAIEHERLVISCVDKLNAGHLKSVCLSGKFFKSSLTALKSTKAVSNLHNIFWAHTPRHLVEYLLNCSALSNRDIILVKGSRGVHMEAFINQLKAVCKK